MDPVIQKRIPAAFYQSAAGAEPVRVWLKEFSALDRRVIGRAIALAEFGWPVGMPVCRPIASRRGLWELRCNISDGRIARLLFCVHEQRLMLLHGFVKKTQKTPEHEIELAVRRKREIER